MTKIILAYLNSLTFRPPATRKTYTQGVKTYVEAVGKNTPIDLETYIKFLKYLKSYSSPSQKVYRSAVVDLYKFACDEFGSNVNLLAMRRADERYLETERRKFHFERDDVNTLVEYAEKLSGSLSNLRDRAFIIFMVDSGTRISEACALRRKDIPWETGQAFIVGKGNKEEKIYFSKRALRAIKSYLDKRAELDGASGVPLEQLPLFARHDPGAGRKIKSIHAGGMWFAFVKRMAEAGIKPSAITPHKLRHEAITRYYEATHNIKETKEFARHARIDTTDRYTHLVDKDVGDSYEKIFNQE